MKKFITALSLFFSTFTFANHTGVHILSYDYIGDSTGVPHQYYVKLSYFLDAASGLYGDTSGITLDILSSCFSPRQATLQYLPATNPHPMDSLGNRANSHYSCGNTAYDFVVYNFGVVVTLPGTCADFKMAATSSCCIISPINIGTSSYITAYATLNNITHEHDMPTVDHRFLQAKTCINKKIDIRQPLMAKTTLDSFKVTDYTRNPQSYFVPWSGSYSPSNPIDTDTAGFNMLSDGTMVFTPIQIGNFIIPMEYQFYDTTGGTSYLAGTLKYAFLVEVVSVCDTAVVKGPDFYFKNQALWDSAQCSDSTLTLHYGNGWDTTSLSPDFSEFQVSYATRNINVPIKRVEFLDSSRLKLVFTDTLRINDTLTVTTQTGTDGDGLMNYCNYAQDKPDTLHIEVVGCTNISRKEAFSLNRLEVYPNPTEDRIAVRDPLQRRISSVLITDAQGRTLSEMLDPGNSFSLAAIPTGLYWLSFSFKDGSQEVHKVIVK